MRLFRAVGALALIAGLAAGCDSDPSGPDVTLATFEGDWEATSFSYTDAQNTQLSLDIIQHLQGTLSLDVGANGSFTGELNIPNVTPTTLPIGGTLALNAAADSVTVTWNATTASYMTADSENCGPGDRLLPDFTAAFSFNETETLLTLTETDADFNFPDQLDPRCSVPAVAVVRLAKS